MPKKDVRGFTSFGVFKCTYGTNVRVKESSAASKPHIWLFLDEDHAVMERSKKGEAAAHLTLANARRLIRNLETAIKNHYQAR